MQQAKALKGSVCLDVFDKKRRHIARYTVQADTSLTMAETELTAGYLVNIRPDALGANENFDLRTLDVTIQ